MYEFITVLKSGIPSRINLNSLSLLASFFNKFSNVLCYSVRLSSTSLKALNS